MTTPAAVGRSWVVRAASVAGSYSLGWHVLEPTQGRAQDAAGAQLGTDLGLDGAEVLADDERALAARLDGHDVEQFGRREAHVRALGPVRRPGGSQNWRNKPMTWSIRSPPACTRTAFTASRNGSKNGGPQLPRDVRRQPPVLPVGTELVRRRADAAAERQQVLVAPGVEPAAVEAHGQVLQHRDVRTGRRRRGAGPATSHWHQAWNRNRSAPAAAALSVTAGWSGWRSSAGQLHHDAPWSSASVQYRAHRSSDGPCAARQRRNGSPPASGPRAAKMRSSAWSFSRRAASRSSRGPLVRARPAWSSGASSEPSSVAPGTSAIRR